MPSIASKPYSAGDVIFECKPIIHCIENDFKSILCDNCLKRSQSLKKCSKCLQMYYCDKECQQMDWKYHKNECKIYRHPKFQMSSSIIIERLLLRLWLCVQFVPNFLTERHQSFDGRDICLKDMRCVLTGIVSDTTTMELFSSLCQHFRDYDLVFESDQLLRWFGMVCNGTTYHFELHNYTDNPSELSYSLFDEPTGAGLYFQNIYSSHSCLPNSDVVTNGI